MSNNKSNNNDQATPGTRYVMSTRKTCTILAPRGTNLKEMADIIAIMLTMVREITVNTPEGPNNGLLMYAPQNELGKPPKVVLVIPKDNEDQNSQPFINDATPNVNADTTTTDTGNLLSTEENAYTPPLVPPRDGDDLFMTMEELADSLDLYPEVIQCALPGCKRVGPSYGLDFHYISSHANHDYIDELSDPES